MNALSCHACGAPLQSTDLDRRLAIITCAACGSIFDLARRKDRDTGAPAVKEPAPERAPVALPDKFEVSRQGSHLQVTWRWFRAELLMLIPFAVAWDSFLVFWYAQALGGAGGPGGFNLLMVIFPLAHVAAGVGITYYAVANLVNRSRVDVTAGTLRVRHGPLPWWPMPTLPARDVEQLYVTRKVRRNKNGTTVTYELRAVTREHAGQLILGGLDELEQALWLEQELEDHLDIRDRPVAGEVRPEGTQR
ncbi:MAG: hypothetical protein H6741_00820 [Alphaproteobacteria bacterium]|nr:hypothetical protein [Alphaproteobacteria bacterium]MCB9791244.1 hypothetical protein [Alphaproteobacteria bacterium]